MTARFLFPLSFVLGILLLAFFLLSSFLVFADAATTSQSLTISAGALTATSPSTATFDTINVSSTNQTASTTIVSIAPSDLRGNGSGWSVTATTGNLALNGSTSTMAGSNNTVNFTGTYNGVASSTGSLGAGTYTVEITTGGAVGTAVFKWTNAASSTTTGVTTAASVSLDSAVSVAFGAATYVVGDKWRFNVSSQPYTGLQATPATLAGTNGSILSEVTLGSASNFAGTAATSNALTLVTAAFGRGVGAYTFNLALSLTVLKYSLAGAHTATLTITVA